MSLFFGWLRAPVIAHESGQVPWHQPACVPPDISPAVAVLALDISSLVPQVRRAVRGHTSFLHGKLNFQQNSRGMTT